MNASTALAAAVSFTWLGMVVAISFLEAPLKFRAPGVTVPIGLGIGRLVFGALNKVEAVFAVGLVAAAAAGRATGPALVLAVTAAALLAGQLAVVRPSLRRRSARVLAGEQLPRSRTHHAYTALECAKVLALLGAGVTLLA